MNDEKQELPPAETKALAVLNGPVDFDRWDYVTLALYALDQAGLRSPMMARVRKVLEKGGAFGSDYIRDGRVELTECQHDEGDTAACLTPCAMTCPTCDRDREIDPSEALTDDLYFAEPCPECEATRCVACNEPGTGSPDEGGRCWPCHKKEMAKAGAPL